MNDDFRTLQLFNVSQRQMSKTKSLKDTYFDTVMNRIPQSYINYSEDVISRSRLQFETGSWRYILHLINVLE